MLGVFRLCVLFFIKNIFVQCLIPTLNVQKLDQNAIQRKRQDTLEMCRIFNAENDRQRGVDLVKTQIKRLAPKKHTKHPNPIRRLKRAVVPETMDVNPGLDFEDAKRVENIVDKFYDDVNEKGKKVTYRKKDIKSLTSRMPTVKLPENLTDPAFSQPSRRFRFRPAKLLGPMEGGPEGYVGAPPSAESYIPWPKVWSHGIVPYFIDPKTYDSQLIEQITKAFDYFEKTTCIRLQKLREKPRDKNSMQDVEWAYITNPSGIKQCVHSNEKKVNKGVQMVVFGYDCMSVGEIIHEIMHVLGFPHEHTRPDRDKYVTVMWDNIKPGYKKYFELRKSDILMTLDLPYDHASVLHYPARAFSRNGQVTLVAEQDVKLGQREALSETDVAKISLIYGAECVNRNKRYLLTTCPSVVKSTTQPEVQVTKPEIEEYFKERLWPFGIVNYKLRDLLEFSADELENIKAVINHIEKETCIEFRDLTEGAQHSKSDEEEQITPDGRPPAESDTEEPTEEPTEPPKPEPEPESSEPEPEPYKPAPEPPEPKPEPTPEPESSEPEPEPYKPAPEPPEPKPEPTPESESSEPELPEPEPYKPEPQPETTTPDTSVPDSEENTPLPPRPPFLHTTSSSAEDEDIPIPPRPPNLQTSSDETIQKLKNVKNKNEISKETLFFEGVRNDGKDGVSDNEIVQLQNVGRSNNNKPQKNIININIPVKQDNLENIAENVIDSIEARNIMKRARSKREAKSHPVPPSPHRRHANNILTLTRSSRPGCPCPKPGKPSGNQVLEINADCFNSVNDLLHLFVHVLGLDHQHNMHDRDNYLHIFWGNMTEEVKREFANKLPPPASVGFPYDYLSVMHYPWLEIKNGNINLMYPIWNDGWAMGHWQGLSSVDVQKLNLLYFNQCMERKKHL